MPRHNEQLGLIDTTPLGLWEARESTIEAQGSQEPSQPATQPVACQGPLRARPTPATQIEEMEADKALRNCLWAKCRKPAREGSCFCSEKCKKAWKANMNAWHESHFRHWKPADGASLPME